MRHGVIETRYAIYPQQSGTVEIPPLSFTATAADNGEQTAGTPRVGRQVQVNSLPLRLTVKPIPASYPSDRPWLPARSLTLEEHWNPDPASQPTQIGDSLTRNITLRVEGLSSTQLPPLPATETVGLRRYPDQPCCATKSTNAAWSPIARSARRWCRPTVASWPCRRWR